MNKITRIFFTQAAAMFVVLAGLSVAANALPCGQGGGDCSAGKVCVLQSDRNQSCDSSCSAYPACLSNSLSSCQYPTATTITNVSKTNCGQLVSGSTTVYGTACSSGESCAVADGSKGYLNALTSVIIGSANGAKCLSYASIPCGQGGSKCNGKKCNVKNTNPVQECKAGYAGYPACMSNSLSGCQ